MSSGKSEGRSAESSEKIVRPVLDEEVEPATGLAGSDLRPLLQKVDTSFLDADLSREKRYCSAYKWKAVVVDSYAETVPAARIGGSDLPRLLQNVDTSFPDFDDEANKASESSFLQLYRIC